MDWQIVNVLESSKILQTHNFHSYMRCHMLFMTESRYPSYFLIPTPGMWSLPALRLLAVFHQSRYGFFFIFLVVGSLFSGSSGASQWWLFHNLVVILMQLWEKASTAFTYGAILMGSLGFMILKCRSCFHQCRSLRLWVPNISSQGMLMLERSEE